MADAADVGTAALKCQAGLAWSCPPASAVPVPQAHSQAVPSAPDSLAPAVLALQPGLAAAVPGVLPRRCYAPSQAPGPARSRSSLCESQH